MRLFLNYFGGLFLVASIYRFDWGINNHEVVLEKLRKKIYSTYDLRTIIRESKKNLQTTLAGVEPAVFASLR